MKKISVIACYLFLLACSKSANQNLFVGTWELRESFSGWGGINTYPKGNGNIITFSDNGNYSGTVVTADTSYSFVQLYKIVEADECGANVSFYQENSSNSYRSEVNLSHDTLSISGGSCIADGGSSVYVRK